MAPVRGWDLVIFDNDGVLVDSEPIAAAVLGSTLADCGTPPGLWQPEEFLGSTVGAVRAAIERRWGRRLPASFETRYHQRLLDRFDAELRPVPGVEAVLACLADAGVACCVASSGSPRRIARALAVTGLDRWFGDRCFSAEVVGRSKPAPDLFLAAAEATGASPAATVVVEDSPVGVAAGLSAGMTVVGYAGRTPVTALSDAHAVVTDMASVLTLVCPTPATPARR